MAFNSLDFAFFFAAVACIYFALPHRFRWVLLLASSYYFYMCWNPKYIILIFASTVLDYFVAIKMGSIEAKPKRIKYLLLSLAGNLGMLFSFKYFNFFNDSLGMVFQHFNLFYAVPRLNVLLPVGISFYTFQTLSYGIDVYRGDRKPERHFGLFAVYVSFFPQLVAGPIERGTHLLPQFREKHRFEYKNASDGLRLILWGLFKKVVVADRLALYVDSVFNNAGQHDSPATFVLATYFFAFQIYCDFSGYSDIAIGSARIMGFDLMRNFKTPYFSKTIAEFWSRWHISLSTWFRDYLYIPLGGNRVRRARWYTNLLIVFLVSGLWHGANWTFVVWGALHGFYLLSGLFVAGLTVRGRAFFEKRSMGFVFSGIQMFICFHLVCLGWVFFRANSLGDALHIVGILAKGGLTGPYIGSLSQFAYGVLGIAILLFVEGLCRGKPIDEALGSLNGMLRWTFYACCVLLFFLIGVFDGGQFIYFQF